MQKDDNVIVFPKMKLDAPPQSAEEIAAKLIEYKTNYADEIAEILWNNLLGELSRSGYDFNENINEYFPSMVLVLESIRSLQLHVNGIHHPLQDFAKESVDEEDADDNSVDDYEEDDNI